MVAKRIMVVAAVSLVMLAGGCSPVDGTGSQQTARPQPVDDRDGDDAVVAATCNDFAVRVYGKVSEGTKENLVVSPYTLVTNVSMLYAGAVGRTESEIENAMRLTIRNERYHRAQARLLVKMRSAWSGEAGGLELAHAIWLPEHAKVRPEYEKRVSDSYNVTARRIDTGNPSQAAGQINRWASEVTRERITHIIDADNLGRNTRIVATSAVCFSARWKQPFDVSLTDQAEFRGLWGNTRSVDMMHQRLVAYGYMKREKYEALVLPYKDIPLSFVIVLPTDKNKLAGLERDIDISELVAVRRSDEDVLFNEVAIPKIAVRSEINLRPVLEHLGMPTAFSDEADCSNLFASGRLSLTTVSQSCMIDVDEGGTSAAAVTLSSGGASMPTRRFLADRPFLYLIVDHSTGVILFMGRYVMP